jgi:hypothetical protein
VIAAFVNDAESWSNVLAHAAQIGAIVVGGLWTYNRFIKQREGFPRANLELVVAHRELNSDHTFLRVVVKVDNVGTALLSTTEFRTDVYRVLPVTSEVEEVLANDRLVPPDERDAAWPCLKSHQGPGAGHIEPGEGDEFGFDFVIPTDVMTVFVYSYIRNVTQEGRELGWTVTKLYDLDEPRGEERELVESRPPRTK